MTKDHPVDGRLQAYLDQELAMDAAEAVERHLLRCPACQERVDELQQAHAAVSGALALLDPAPRTADRDALLWEVRRRSVRRRSGRHRERLAAAAVVVLLLGAGAAAAMPGSPLRGWLFGPDTPDAQPTATQVEEGAALSLELQEGAAGVEVEGLSVRVPVEVRVTPGPRVEVHAPPGAGFQTGAGWVRVSGTRETGTLRIELPERARSARVTIDGVLRAEVVYGRLLVDGAEVVAPDPVTGWIRIPDPDEGGRSDP
jgi:anti-sigma factor RsiW